MIWSREGAIVDFEFRQGRERFNGVAMGKAAGHSTAHALVKEHEQECDPCSCVGEAICIAADEVPF